METRVGSGIVAKLRNCDNNIEIRCSIRCRGSSRLPLALTLPPASGGASGKHSSRDELRERVDEADRWGEAKRADECLTCGST